MANCMTRGAPAVVIWPNVARLLSAVAGCPHWNQLNALNASTRTSTSCASVDPDHPRQRQIEAARAHPADAVARAGAQRAGGRLRERRRVQEPHAAVGRVDRHVGVRVVEHLIRPLRAGLTVQARCRSRS